MAIDPVTLDAVAGAARVPALLFVPRSDEPLPLVLLGHGAHQSKDDPIAQLLARSIARGVPAGVALMDCPGHGERRVAGSSDEEFAELVGATPAAYGFDCAGPRPANDVSRRMKLHQAVGREAIHAEFNLALREQYLRQLCCRGQFTVREILINIPVSTNLRQQHS